MVGAFHYSEKKKSRGQQTDSISLLCYTKASMRCQTVKTYTSRIAIGPPCEVLCRFNVCLVCAQACACDLLYTSVYCLSEFIHLCARLPVRKFLHLCILWVPLPLSVRACMFNTPPSFFTNLILWSILLKSVALTLYVSRPDKWKHARARRRRRKKKCYTSWSTIRASLPREALEGSLGLQLALKICNCALQLLIGVSELWFVWFRIGRISSNYYLLQLCLHCLFVRDRKRGISPFIKLVF